MIKERIEKIKELEQELLSHPMCASYEDQRLYLLVAFPNSVDGQDGVRVHTNRVGGKAAALRELIERCENAWQQDNAWWLN